MAPRSSKGSLTCTATSSLVLLCFGLAVIAVGILVPGQVRNKLQEGIQHSVIWTPFSPPDVDARFRSQAVTDTSAPADLFNVWMFNITNIDEVRAGGLPKLEQVGPYVHRVYHEKLDVLWDADGRVYFKDYTHYHLDMNLTKVDVNANITTWNLGLLGVLANLHGSVAPEYRPFVDVLMQAISSYTSTAGMSGVFTTRPALDLLWGYDDPLLQLLTTLLPPGTLQDGSKVRLLKNTSSVAEALGRKPIKVNTGAKDPAHIWNIEADQERTVVTSWPCDPEPVHGSDASQFQPGLTTSSPVEVWIADLFQARRLVVNSTVDLDGIKLLRYWLDPAQSELNPCRNQEVQGLMNITTPQAAGFSGDSSVSGPFVFVSMPMFCGANESLAADVGLTCDMDQHMTWVDVEPTTGITMRVLKRLMMSSRVGDLGSVLDPAVRQNLTIPMFWAEESVALTHQLAEQFKSRVYTALWVLEHLGKMCWIGGGLLVLLGVILAVLTVELAADPDKWPGRSEAVVAAAGRMFRANSSPPGGTAAGADQGGPAGPSSSSGGVAGGDAEQGLQEPLLQAPAGSSRQEIVEG